MSRRAILCCILLSFGSSYAHPTALVDQTSASQIREATDKTLTEENLQRREGQVVKAVLGPKAFLTFNNSSSDEQIRSFNTAMWTIAYKLENHPHEIPGAYDLGRYRFYSKLDQMLKDPRVSRDPLLREFTDRHWGAGKPRFEALSPYEFCELYLRVLSVYFDTDNATQAIAWFVLSPSAGMPESVSMLFPSAADFEAYERKNLQPAQKVAEVRAEWLRFPSITIQKLSDPSSHWGVDTAEVRRLAGKVEYEESIAKDGGINSFTNVFDQTDKFTKADPAEKNRLLVSVLAFHADNLIEIIQGQDRLLAVKH